MVTDPRLYTFNPYSSFMQNRNYDIGSYSMSFQSPVNSVNTGNYAFQYGDPSYSNPNATPVNNQPPTTGQGVDPNAVAGATIAGLGFTNSLIGYGGVLNNSDISPITQEQKIDRDNPYLSARSWRENQAKYSPEAIKSQNFQRASSAILGGAGAGAAIGSFLGPGGTAIGALGGALVGGVASIFGGKSRRNKMRRKRAMAFRNRKGSIDQYNVATKGAYESDVMTDRIGMMQPQYMQNSLI